MEQTTEKDPQEMTQRLTIINTILLVLLFGLLGFVMVRLIKPPDVSCVVDSEVTDQVGQIQIDIQNMGQDIDMLRVQAADITDRLSQDTAADTGPAGPNLPKSYVQLVNDFFKGTHSIDLLSDKARGMGTWRFKQPHFIDSRVIYVDYANSRMTETMIVEITIINYYDLQFNVIWDSLEAK